MFSSISTLQQHLQQTHLVPMEPNNKNILQSTGKKLNIRMQFFCYWVTTGGVYVPSVNIADCHFTEALPVTLYLFDSSQIISSR